jgi:hypothetical protein
MLLADWFPRKVVADTAYLTKLPKLLRAFIGYCHNRRGIRSALTEETLAAVDHWEPQYQRMIRSARPQGPAALLAGLFARPDDEDDRTVREIMLESLDRTVGGRIQSQNLQDAPLPDEPFEWAGVAEDIRFVIQQMLAACDRCADELLDVEHRTAMRRFLSRAAVGDPAPGRAASTRQRRRPTPSLWDDGTRGTRPADLESTQAHHHTAGPLARLVKQRALPRSASGGHGREG